MGSRSESYNFTIQGLTPLSPLDFEKLPEHFEEKLFTYSNDPFKGIGVALMLRESIEFLIMKKRGSREGWLETKEFLQRGKDYFSKEVQNNMVGSANKMLNEMPFKEEQWISTGKKWRELLSNQRSDDYIDQWRNFNVT